MIPESQQRVKPKPTLLVTGAAGRIASYLLPHLDRHYSIVITDHPRKPLAHLWPQFPCDLREASAVQEVVGRCDYVLHLAGESSLRAEWKGLWQNNVVATRNILTAAENVACKRVIVVSSIHAEAEKYNFETSRYGKSKALVESMTKRFHAGNPSLFTVIRLGWVIPRREARKHIYNQHFRVVLFAEDLLAIIVKLLDQVANAPLYEGLSDPNDVMVVLRRELYWWQLTKYLIKRWLFNASREQCLQKRLNRWYTQTDQVCEK